MPANVKIAFEQGGSVLNVGEPGCGAVSNVFVRYQTGACEIINSGASAIVDGLLSIGATGTASVAAGGSFVSAGVTISLRGRPVTSSVYQYWPGRMTSFFTSTAVASRHVVRPTHVA